MSTLYYVALVVDEKVPGVYDAGVDLLDGPYFNRETAENAVERTRQRIRSESPRTWFALGYDEEHIRVDVVALRENRFRHIQRRLRKQDRVPDCAKLPWPPPLAWGDAAYCPARVISEKGIRDGEA